LPRRGEPDNDDCQFRDFDTGYFWMSAGDFFGILNTLYVCRMFKTPDPWRSLRFYIQTLDPVMKTSMYTCTRNHQRGAETLDPISKHIMYQIS
jgi:hypothetical protein